jgi:hypothetical protein
MKVTLLVLACGSAAAFQPVFTSLIQGQRSRSSLSMVLEKPKTKKVAKIEVLKIESDYLTEPLKEVRH